MKRCEEHSKWKKERECTRCYPWTPTELGILRARIPEAEAARRWKEAALARVGATRRATQAPAYVTDRQYAAKLRAENMRAIVTSFAPSCANTHCDCVACQRKAWDHAVSAWMLTCPVNPNAEGIVADRPNAVRFRHAKIN